MTQNRPSFTAPKMFGATRRNGTEFCVHLSVCAKQKDPEIPEFGKRNGLHQSSLN